MTLRPRHRLGSPDTSNVGCPSRTAHTTAAPGRSGPCAPCKCHSPGGFWCATGVGSSAVVVVVSEAKVRRVRGRVDGGSTTRFAPAELNMCVLQVSSDPDPDPPAARISFPERAVGPRGRWKCTSSPASHPGSPALGAGVWVLCYSSVSRVPRVRSPLVRAMCDGEIRPSSDRQRGSPCCARPGGEVGGRNASPRHERPFRRRGLERTRLSQINARGEWPRPTMAARLPSDVEGWMTMARRTIGWNY